MREHRPPRKKHWSTLALIPCRLLVVVGVRN
jgi:hypothetical protein